MAYGKAFVIGALIGGAAWALIRAGTPNGAALELQPGAVVIGGGFWACVYVWFRGLRNWRK